MDRGRREPPEGTFLIGSRGSGGSTNVRFGLTSVIHLTRRTGKIVLASGASIGREATNAPETWGPSNNVTGRNSMANAAFWRSVVLQAIGPLITVFVGSLVIGPLAAGITARVQRRREEQQLRHDLIVGMAETTSALYLATQRYWRAKDPNDGSLDPLHRAHRVGCRLIGVQTSSFHRDPPCFPNPHETQRCYQ